MTKEINKRKAKADEISEKINELYEEKEELD